MKSLESIFAQIDDSFEVVVADQASTDGSREVLQKYAREGKVRVYEMARRNRGLGRQRAFECSMGDYIIASVDLDMVYKPILPKLLEVYREQFSDKIVRFDSLEIASRGAIEKIGGWRDLQWGEDIEHWARAAKAGMFVDIPDISVTSESRPFGRGRSRWGVVKYRYEMMRDLNRIGRHRWDKVKDSPSRAGKVFMFFMLVVATVGSAFSKSYRDPWNNSFRMNDYVFLGNLDLPASIKLEGHNGT